MLFSCSLSSSLLLKHGRSCWQNESGTHCRGGSWFRALKLGDMLCAVPAFRSLRAAFPEALIVLAGLPWALEFVNRYCSYLDGFREFPGYPGLPEREPEMGCVQTFLKAMQAEKFDLCIQMHGSGGITNGLIARFGARQSAGFFERGTVCPDPSLSFLIRIGVWN